MSLSALNFITVSELFLCLLQSALVKVSQPPPELASNTGLGTD